MHPRLKEIDDFLGERRAEVAAAVAAVPDTEDLVAVPGAWSVAAIIEHLRLTETSVSKLLHVTVSRLPAEGRITEMETASVLHSVDHDILANRDKRIMAPPMVRPRTDLSLAEALAGLETSRAALQRSMREADGLALGGISYPHPVLGTLDLYQWLVFIGLHESRHACQIRELAHTRLDS